MGVLTAVSEREEDAGPPVRFALIIHVWAHLSLHSVGRAAGCVGCPGASAVGMEQRLHVTRHADATQHNTTHCQHTLTTQSDGPTIGSLHSSDPSRCAANGADGVWSHGGGCIDLFLSPTPSVAGVLISSLRHDTHTEPLRPSNRRGGRRSQVALQPISAGERC